MRNALAALVVLSTLIGCGGGGGGGARTPSQPSAVTTPTPLPPPSFADGLSGAPVGGATATPAQPASGATITVRADGYLVREQPYDGQRIFLWPGDEGYVRALVYDTEFRDGSFRMVRWADTGFTLTLDAEIADDGPVLAKVEDVLTHLRALTGLPMQVGPGGSVVLRIDAEENDAYDSVAFVDLSYMGASIVGADVVFSSRAEITGGRGADYPNTFLHEMGHVLGLGHSIDTNDVMTPGEGPGTRYADLQPAEAGCLRMMYVHRRAGNRPPDRDPALGAAIATVPWRSRIIDR